MDGATTPTTQPVRDAVAALLRASHPPSIDARWENLRAALERAQATALTGDELDDVLHWLDVAQRQAPPEDVRLSRWLESTIQELEEIDLQGDLQSAERARSGEEQATARRVLALLFAQQAPMRPGAIATHLEIDKWQVSRALGRLVDEEAVVLVDGPAGEDRRGRWYQAASALPSVDALSRRVVDALRDLAETEDKVTARAVDSFLEKPSVLQQVRTMIQRKDAAIGEGVRFSEEEEEVPGQVAFHLQR